MASRGHILSRLHMLSRFIITALVVLCLPLATATAQTSTYIITDLGTLPGDTASQAYYINNRGQVVGQSRNNMRSRAFLYSNGTMSDISSGQQDSTATGINDAGQVAGHTLSRAFIYSGGALTILATPNGALSKAYAINNSGQVVGVYGDFESYLNAFLYSEGAVIDLGRLFGARISYANSINNSGHIAGQIYTSYPSPVTAYAFLYSNGTVSKIIDNGSACCINDSGQVAGTYSRDGFFYAFIYSCGRVTDLGTLPGGKYSEAYGLNLRGQVVGSSRTATPNSARPFLYSDGVMHDLNDLLPANSGWVLDRVFSINDGGQIVGIGTFSGQSRAVLLTPNATTPPSGPLLLTEECSQQAVALDSVTFTRAPFPAVAAHNFSADQRTRIMLFARNVELLAGEDFSAVTAQAEDAQHRAYALPVEFVGKIPNFEWLTQVNVKLTDELMNVSEVWVSIGLRGRISNKVLIRIR